MVWGSWMVVVWESMDGCGGVTVGWLWWGVGKWWWCGQCEVVVAWGCWRVQSGGRRRIDVGSYWMVVVLVSSDGRAVGVTVRLWCVI